MSFKTWLAAAALCLMGGGQAEAASATFKDWTVACDNVRRCTAFGFSTEDQEAQAFLKVERAGAPGAVPQMILAVASQELAGQPWSVAVDGRTVPGLSGLKSAPSDDDAYAKAPLSPSQGAALMTALGNGAVVTVKAAKGASAEVSLAGSSAALRWMDDQQKRAGTVTALIARGPKPANQVPAPPPPPQVVVGKAPVQTGVSDVLPKTVRARFGDDCDKDLSEDMHDVISARLAPGVILWGDVCAVAAYQSAYSLFLADEKGGHVRPLSLEDGKGGLLEDTLIGASFDLDSMTLSSFYKGRGLADCGGSQTWVWDGGAFRLTEETYMDACRGVPPEDWPVTYVARTR